MRVELLQGVLNRNTNQFSFMGFNNLRTMEGGRMMNLRKLYEIQAELDKKIVEKHNLQGGEDLLPKKILALQVELGELANEARFFKFWSKDQKPRTKIRCNVLTNYGSYNETKNPLLEEYVDCLHFILSIGLELESDLEEVIDGVLFNPYYRENITEQFRSLFYFTSHVLSGKYIKLFNAFYGLGKMLGFTCEEIEADYLRKNEINHTRQDNNY
jgi:dimeric dUTPase (all-alpha-NTP-PPase superfamily)